MADDDLWALRALCLLFLSILITFVSLRQVRRTVNWRRPRTPYDATMWGYVVVTPVLWILFAIACVNAVR